MSERFECTSLAKKALCKYSSFPLLSVGRLQCLSTQTQVCVSSCSSVSSCQNELLACDAVLCVQAAMGCVSVCVCVYVGRRRWVQWATTLRWHACLSTTRECLNTSSSCLHKSPTRRLIRSVRRLSCPWYVPSITPLPVCLSVCLSLSVFCLSVKHSFLTFLMMASFNRWHNAAIQSIF